jgi:hypothetical protein
MIVAENGWIRRVNSERTSPATRCVRRTLSPRKDTLALKIRPPPFHHARASSKFPRPKVGSADPPTQSPASARCPVATPRDPAERPSSLSRRAHAGDSASRTHAITISRRCRRSVSKGTQLRSDHRGALSTSTTPIAPATVSRSASCPPSRRFATARRRVSRGRGVRRPRERRIADVQSKICNLDPDTAAKQNATSY